MLTDNLLEALSAASFEHSPCPGCACGKSSGRLGLGPAPHPRLPHAGRQPPSWGRAGDGGLGGGAGPASAEERALFSEAGTPRWPPGLCLHRPPLDSRPAPGPPESRRALALGPLSTAPFVVTGAFFSLRVPLQTWSQSSDSSLSPRAFRHPLVLSQRHWPSSGPYLQALSPASLLFPGTLSSLRTSL